MSASGNQSGIRTSPATPSSSARRRRSASCRSGSRGHQHRTRSAAGSSARASSRRGRFLCGRRADSDSATGRSPSSSRARSSGPAVGCARAVMPTPSGTTSTRSGSTPSIAHDVLARAARVGDDTVGTARAQRDQHPHPGRARARVGLGSDSVDQVVNRDHAAEAPARRRGVREAVHQVDARPLAPVAAAGAARRAPTRRGSWRARAPSPARSPAATRAARPPPRG